MAFDSKKRNHVQIGLSDGVLTDLTILVARIGREIGMPHVTRGKVATWALHHLLTTKFALAVEIVEAGRIYEQKCLRKCLRGSKVPSNGKAPSVAGHGTVGRHVPAVNGEAKRRALPNLCPLPKNK